ncbi:MAG: FG-GAP repeat domain-containing protein [Bacteroidota bacterium]
MKTKSIILIGFICTFLLSCEKDEILKDNLEDQNQIAELKSASDTDFGSWDNTYTAIKNDAYTDILVGDFDGDGVEDLLYRWEQSGNKRIYYDDDNTFGNHNDDTYWIYGFWGQPFQDDDSFCADMDGDGKCDIMNVDNLGWLTIDLASDGLGDTDSCFSGYGYMESYTFCFADLDGDTKADVFRVDNYGNVRIDYADDGFGSWDVSYSGYGDRRDNTFILADMDGDNLADIFKVGKDGYIHFDYADDGFGSWDEHHSGYGDKRYNTFRLKDLDGDGSADIARLNNSGYVRIDYADDGFGSWDESHSGYGSQRNRSFYCGDYDGDTKADIIVWVDYSFHVDWADE